MSLPPCALLFLFALSPALADEPGRSANAQEAEFFEARVRPVFVEHCVGCHGPEKQKSGLRLDSAAAILKGGESGPVIEPGKPDESTLIEAINHDGPVKMPPKSRLQDQAIADLTAWVTMGAPWPASNARPEGEAWRRHWAFQPIRDPAVPEVKDDAWPKTSIDRFVLKSLEAKGLTPSSMADRRTLIRRATFDLIGLPPTPEEVEAFIDDGEPKADARLIDRLLASPHYGERWGRHWLDVARYADTKGYVFFEEASYPWAYTYRDWVVRALNEDMPYDQFLIHQLAADRLPLGEDRRSLAALGFLTVGGRFMNNQQDILDDRIDVVTRGLMGLTVSCARCHDHKFDPIPTADYYALHGVFASTVEPTVPPLFEPEPTTKDYVVYSFELEVRERKLAEFVRSKHEELVNSARVRAAEYLLAAQAATRQPDMAEFMLIADGGDLNPKMVNRWQSYLRRTRRPHHPVFAPWHALAALPPAEFPAKAGALCSEWVSNADPARPINLRIARALAEAPPQNLADAARAYSRVLNEVDSGASPSDDADVEQLRRVFHGPDAPPDVSMSPLGDLDLLPDRDSQAKLQELRKAVETWRISGFGAPPRAMAVEDKSRPIEPRVFLRGNANNLGPAVPRRFLSVLSDGPPKPFRDGSGRLELARAIVSRDNPLTARVLVNRVWMHHFGSPLVGTPSDFGLRSDPPTNPELLDHLATCFINDGWSLKRLHRRIMLSSAYQQASDDRPECRRVDPENTLLWKMNRRRLDFESMRDAIVFVSGRLDRSIGGPPMPDLTSPMSTRRTLYGSIDRLNLPGLFRAFDYPDPAATSPRRDQTTVPPQALFLMNHPFVIEAARGVLKRPEIAAEADIGNRVGPLYRLFYGRDPDEKEIDLARRFLQVSDGPAPWDAYVQGLMLANEFVFMD